MHPFAFLDTAPVFRVKRDLDAATAEARRLYAEFDASRSAALKTHGYDGIATKPDVVEALNAKSVKLDAAEADVNRLRGEFERLALAHTDSRSSKAAGGDSFGAAFVKAMGGPEAVARKAIDGTVGGTIVPADADDRIRNLPERSLFVRSLIPVVTTDSDKVSYVEQTVGTYNADAVADGATKPTTLLGIERREVRISTLAHLSHPIHRNLLADIPSVIQFVDGSLRLGLALAEEEMVLAGDTTVNAAGFTGILNKAGVQVQARGADTTADALYKAITKVRLGNLVPDAICLHPSDFSDLRLAKLSDGQYLSAEIVAGDPDRIFGLPVITSPVMPEGTGLVGAFAQGATMYDREQTTVALSEHHGTLFVTNEVIFRCESRVALAITRPSAFCKITGI